MKKVKKKAILLFGDSITYGVDSEVGGWANLLRPMIEKKFTDTYYDVYNLGIPGEDSKGLLKRIKHECQARSVGHKNTYIVIATGGNDILKAEFMYHLEDIVHICKDFSHNIYIASVLETDLNKIKKQEWFDGVIDRYTGQEIYNDIIQQVCKNHKTKYIDTFSIIKTKHLTDGVHLTEEGNRDYCCKIFQELAKDLGGDK